MSEKRLLLKIMIDIDAFPATYLVVDFPMRDNSLHPCLSSHHELRVSQGIPHIETDPFLIVLRSVWKLGIPAKRFHLYNKAFPHVSTCFHNILQVQVRLKIGYPKIC